MALKYKERKGKGYEILDLTSLTEEESEILVVPFEQAFQAYMAQWRMDGKPRTRRRYSTYKNCPLATSEERLLFILVYLKNQSLQVLQGRLFGMPQCKANTWIQLLLTIPQKTLLALGDTPSRNLDDLAKRLTSTTSAASHLLVDVTTEAATETGRPNDIVPLFAMMAANAPLVAPKIRLNRKVLTAAQKSAIP